MNWRLPFLLLFCCAFAFACSLGEEPRKGPPDKIAVDAAGPDFILKDLKGQEVSLGSFRDRPILLVFGTTWCPYCREEIPRIKEIYRLGREKNLEVLNIFINEPEAKVSAFAAKYALPYRVLLDSDGRVAERYQVRGVPTLVLLDRQGKIVCYQCRNLDAMLKGL
jgi:cytochrome c biogenesis protein CcmG/thiol:disulfide interchange protein DsbE